jgi:uncharacterized membrane protein (UPF0136 family)
MANTILWVYIGLLVAGGLAGFLKAGSKISLVTSVLFAAALAAFASAALAWTPGADILLFLLLVVFVIRYAKGKKFMPAGLMIVLTVAALGLHLFATRAG